MSESGPVPADLREAYGRAWYRVGEGDETLELPLDAPSPALRALYQAYEVSSALFITACNPFSHLSSETDNRADQARLRAVLAACSPHVLPAAGGDRAGRWPTEPAFLALGVNRAQGLALGREFRQHAVLWAGPDAVMRLQWCFTGA